MIRLVRLFAALTFLAAASSAFAQFGHPLKGTWSGDRSAGSGSRVRVLLEFHWDGKAITGSINPGANAAPFKVATVDPATWAVHVEADGKDDKGANVHTVIDGK